jgi:CO/xanthine dehydrogenase FAD-binding subunit
VATVLSRLALLQPRSLAEALRLLRDEGPLVPLAGCTDLYVGLHFGTLREPRFLDLQGLRALRGIRRRGDTLVIGALATYAELIASPLVRRRLPILAEASRWVGSPQIQNRGTLGGNVANASPAGDTLPVLAVAEATVVLRSVDGERRVPFASFYMGYRQTVMRPDELIVAIEVPPIEGRQWFRKVGTRAAQAISKVVMAGVRAPRPRLALGSVAPTVVRLPRTEAVLAEGGTLAEAQGVLMDEIQPIDDLRSTAEYRRRVSANLLAQFWADTGRRGRARTTRVKARPDEPAGRRS